MTYLRIALERFSSPTTASFRESEPKKPYTLITKWNSNNETLAANTKLSTHKRLLWWHDHFLWEHINTIHTNSKYTLLNWTSLWELNRLPFSFSNDIMNNLRLFLSFWRYTNLHRWSYSSCLNKGTRRWSKVRWLNSEENATSTSRGNRT